MDYAEVSYFDGYAFQHIAKYVDRQRDAMLEQRRNQLGRQFIEARHEYKGQASGSALH